MRGKFLVIEGVDGAGKSTQIAGLKRFLERRGRSVLTLREPGGTAIGEQVRAILLDRRHQRMRTETELFLYCAARAQIVREVIEPALRAGRDVVCDRFTLSTLVYQAYLGGLPLRRVQDLCLFAMGATRPDLCLVLDLPPRESLRRRKRRAGGPDRMEAKQRHALTKMRTGYRLLARRAGYPCQIVDATGTPGVVAQRLEAALAAALHPAPRLGAERRPRTKPRRRIAR